MFLTPASYVLSVNKVQDVAIEDGLTIAHVE